MSVQIASFVLAVPAFADDKVALRAAIAQQLVLRYQRAHALGDLSSAVDAICTSLGDPRLPTQQNVVDQRRIMVAGYANIIKAIDQAYDPTFDRKAKLECPVLPNDPNFMPCSDPSLTPIADQATRATYEAQWAAFQHLKAQTDYYWSVQRVDDYAMGALESTLDFFRRFGPKDTPTDLAALEDILVQSGISASRRAAIEAVITAR